MTDLLVACVNLPVRLIDRLGDDAPYWFLFVALLLGGCGHPRLEAQGGQRATVVAQNRNTALVRFDDTARGVSCYSLISNMDTPFGAGVPVCFRGEEQRP